jgi:hypothetical protein
VTDQNKFSMQGEWLAQTFEAKRAHLRAVAHRMPESRIAKREEALDVPDAASAFDDRSCHIRQTSFVSVMTDQVMHKETGFETESDWLLDGYGIGSAPAAIA